MLEVRLLARLEEKKALLDALRPLPAAMARLNEQLTVGWLRHGLHRRRRRGAGDCGRARCSGGRGGGRGQGHRGGGRGRLGGGDHRGAEDAKKDDDHQCAHRQTGSGFSFHLLSAFHCSVICC